MGGVQFDKKLTLLIILTVLVPMLDRYDHTLFSEKAYDRFFYYFIIPLLFIWLILRQPAAEYGLQWGNWKEGVAWTVGVCGVMGLVLWFLARTPAMQQFYAARAYHEVGRLIFLNGVEMFGWEFIWRGLVLFAYVRAFGPGPAIFLQAVPFAYMHLGKPEVETLSTIFGGAGFGWIAWRTKSFAYPWFIHWFMVSLTMLIASGRM